MSRLQIIEDAISRAADTFVDFKYATTRAWITFKLWVTLHRYIIELLERVMALEKEANNTQAYIRNITETLIKDREALLNGRESNPDSVPASSSDPKQTTLFTRRRSDGNPTEHEPPSS